MKKRISQTFSANEIRLIYLISSIGIVIALLSNFVALLSSIIPSVFTPDPALYAYSVYNLNFDAFIILFTIFLGLLYFRAKILFSCYKREENLISSLLSLLIIFIYLALYCPIWSPVSNLPACLITHTSAAICVFFLLFFTVEATILQKTAFTTFIFVGITLVLVLEYNYYCSKKHLESVNTKKIENSFKSFSSTYNLLISQTTHSAEETTNILFYALGQLTKEQIAMAMREKLKFNGALSGLGYIDVPKNANSDDISSVYVSSNSSYVVDIVSLYKKSNMDYTKLNWYKIPLETQKMYISEPKPNRAGDWNYTATCSIPVFDNQAD